MNAKQGYINACVRSLQEEKGWTFERAWNHVLASSPDLLDGSVSAGFAKTKVGRDPRVDQELNKHAKVEQSKRSAAIGDHVERLAKIRALMAADPSINFDQAFTQVCQQEAAATVATLPTSAAARKETRWTMLVAAGGSSDDMVEAVRAEHPEWSEARCEKFCWEEYWT
jgi:hypothetical protein